jgi:two-component system, OmpR family, sensor histidine kinase KdpD
MRHNDGSYGHAKRSSRLSQRPMMPEQVPLHTAAPTGSRDLGSGGISFWRLLVPFGSPLPAGERQNLRVALTSLAFIGLLTLLGLWIAPIIREPNLAILYMLAVVFSTLRWGRLAAIISAIASAVSFDFFFVPPSRSFVAGDLWYLITLVGLLAVGLTVSILTLVAKEEAKAARQREAQTAALYAFAKSLAEAGSLDQIFGAITHHVVETFSRPTVLFLPGVEGLAVHFRSEGLILDRQDIAAAARVFESGEEAGCATGEFATLKMRYRPLKTSQGTLAVLGILASSPEETLPADRQQLLGTFMNMTALAITRANLARKAQQAEILQEADRFRKALLNSISHNLRTPITSVVGALTSVLEDGAVLDASAQRTLLRTAQSEAIRLNRLIQNLLDMSRLEGGAISVKTEPCDVHDVIDAALEQLAETARKRPILITIAPNLPLVPMDEVLIVQVVFNLVDNALKYSPADIPIEIQARLHDDELELLVADRGNGIREHDLERVFEKFFRAASPRAPRGAGLGLSICRGFVNAHGGRIWASCRPHGGTQVAFVLPVRGAR